MTKTKVHLFTILAHLRNHNTITGLPGIRFIGSGCYRSAYAIGDYVVKKHNRACSQYRNRYPLPKGVYYPHKEWKVGKWVVQPKYKRMSDRQWDKLFNNRCYRDLHPGNLGYDKRGRVVAFDW